MVELENLIRVAEKKEERARYSAHKDLFDTIREFIIKKRRILYGGTALNEMLPPADKFYPATQLPDYDVYTPFPRKDAIDLAKHLTKKGYRYIEIKNSLWHKTTFKVFAEFQSVVDFTYIRPSFYRFLLERSASNPIENQSDRRLILAPPILLILSFYQEFARPKGSLHRLAKIVPRFRSFLKHFHLKGEDVRSDPHDVPTVYDMAYLEPIREYIREKQVPDIGGFAIGLHMGENRWNRLRCCVYPGLPFFDLLSPDMEATVQELQARLPPFRVKKIRVQDLREILPARYSLSYDLPGGRTKVFARIIDGSAGCYAIDTIAGYTVGTLNTILFHLYGILVSQMFFRNTFEQIPASSFTLAMIQKLEKMNARKTARDRFTIRCAGAEKTMEDILREKWGKKNFHLQF